MASPRLIPVPDSPTHSREPALPPIMGDSGNTSASFGQQCTPSPAPECASSTYGNLSYGQIRNECKSRKFKTRFDAMDAVARQSLKPNENDMDTSSSVLEKRGRSMAEPSNTENATQRAEGKRSRGDTPATTLAVDLAVAHAHPQWWTPDLKLKS